MNPSLLVLDTSVLVKWYRRHEADANKALAIRDAYLAGQVALAAPDFALVEFANVVRYMTDWSTSQVQLAVESLLSMELTWLPATENVLKRAVAIARQHDTPVYDALFAALAQELGGLYVTADRRFVDRVPELDYVQSLAGFPLP